MESVLQKLLNLCMPHLLCRSAMGKLPGFPSLRPSPTGLQHPQTPAPLSLACRRSQYEAGNGEMESMKSSKQLCVSSSVSGSFSSHLLAVPISQIFL